MSHFSGHFEGASTFLTPKLFLASKKSWFLKMSIRMVHKFIVPQKKIMSRSFLNSGTLIVTARGLRSGMPAQEERYAARHCFSGHMKEHNILYSARGLRSVMPAQEN
jgi:hypothetical protein